MTPDTAIGVMHLIGAAFFVAGVLILLDEDSL